MSKFLFPLLIFSIFFSTPSYSQTDSPYELDWAIDGPWVGGGLGLNAMGVLLIQNKPDLTEAEFNSLSKEDIFFLDRWAAGNYSPSADKLSYYPFYASFTLPLFLMLNENERNHAGQISVLFVEAMATTGALFTITAGAIQRSRPLVYNTSVPKEERIENDAQRSFFGGHVSATAAATFFTAKVFNDFNPDSPLKPYIWTAAALVPAWVGYLRLKSGKHFLTDNLLGYGIGALSGIIIPELHKKDNENISFYPSFGRYSKGITFKYTF